MIFKILLADNHYAYRMVSGFSLDGKRLRAAVSESEIGSRLGGRYAHRPVLVGAERKFHGFPGSDCLFHEIREDRIRSALGRIT